MVAHAAGAGGLLACLSESEPLLQVHALKGLLKVVDQHWAEVSSAISRIEAFAEDDGFAERQLASLLASKARRRGAAGGRLRNLTRSPSQVFYHLGELNDALTYALGAGALFDVAEESEFVTTLLGAARAGPPSLPGPAHASAAPRSQGHRPVRGAARQARGVRHRAGRAAGGHRGAHVRPVRFQASDSTGCFLRSRGAPQLLRGRAVPAGHRHRARVAPPGQAGAGGAEQRRRARAPGVCAARLPDARLVARLPTHGAPSGVLRRRAGAARRLRGSAARRCAPG